MNDLRATVRFRGSKPSTGEIAIRLSVALAAVGVIRGPSQTRLDPRQRIAERAGAAQQACARSVHHLHDSSEDVGDGIGAFHDAPPEDRRNLDAARLGDSLGIYLSARLGKPPPPHPDRQDPATAAKTKPPHKTQQPPTLRAIGYSLLLPRNAPKPFEG